MTGEAAQALAPVRAHLLHGAEAETSRILAEARAQAEDILRQARRGAAETVDRAWAQGAADAGQAAAAERSRGRDQARSIVLGARREAFQELRAQVLAAAGGLRAEPGYRQLLDRLVTMATRAAWP